MASQLYQVIEGLSRDKGIDPQIVVAAVEDAIALATRKYYKTQENMRAELDKETGEIRAYAYKTVTWAARFATTSPPTCWGASPRRWPSR
jgi:N utilization substance protein A